MTAAVNEYRDDPNFVIALARLLAAAPEATVRDGGRALALVEPVMKAAATLDAAETVAMALAEVGRFDEAAALQREAVAQAHRIGDARAAARLAAGIALYERRQPARTPWQHDPLYEPTR